MTDKRRYKMVVAIDFSEMSEVVMETALDLAGRHDAPELHVLSVLAAPRGLRKLQSADHGVGAAELEALDAALGAFVTSKLDDFDSARAERADWRVHVHARMGGAAEQIVYLAWEAEADLIILGRHGHVRWPRFLMGSVPERVLRMARCPVLTVQPTDYGLPERDPDEALPACAECVAVRRDSDGARWFCQAHSNYKLSRSMYMAHHHTTTLPIGGGPLL